MNAGLIFLSLSASWALMAASNIPVTTPAPGTKPAPDATKPATEAAKRPRAKKRVAPDIVASVDSASPAVRRIALDPNSVPVIHVATTTTTAIEIPEGERIMEIFGVDSPGWKVSANSGSWAYVRPVKSPSSLSIHISTDHGNDYPFLLIADKSGADLTVILTPGQKARALIAAPPQWVPAEIAEAFRKEAETERVGSENSRRQAAREISDAQADAKKAIADFQRDFPSKLRFGYEWRHDKKDERLFRVASIFATPTQTFIYADPSEAPALYEKKDGKLSLVSYRFADHAYRVDQVITEGALVVGKHKLTFHLRGDE